VHAGPRAAIATVLGEEDADVVPLGRAGDQRRLHVDDRRVADERARIDDAAGTDLEGRDRDVIRGAVVLPAGQVVDAGLGEARNGSSEHQGECYGDAHGAGPYPRG
jgi:hypothetical protein